MAMIRIPTPPPKKYWTPWEENNSPPQAGRGIRSPDDSGRCSPKAHILLRNTCLSRAEKDDVEGYILNLDEDGRNIAFRIYRLSLTDGIEYNFNNMIEKLNWETMIDRAKL
jgi:hypothetical protein